VAYFAVKEAHDELLGIWDRSAIAYKAAVENLLPTLVPNDARNTDANRQAGMKRLHTVVWHTQVLADLLARKRALMEARAAARARGRNLAAYFAAEDQNVIPQVPFTEAVEDLVRREPKLADEVPGGEPRYKKVQELYRTGHSFAVTKSMELELTKKIRDYISDAINTGTPVPAAKDILSAVLDWSKAYSETVFRTNVQTAYQAGRFRQAFDPDVAEIMRAFEYDAVLDSDVRENHAAAHGFLAPTTDERWHTFSPPMGYNCRCGTRFIDIWELRQRGLLEKSGRIKVLLPSNFAAAHPDKGFGGRRPDLLIYAGSLF
jgi:SPP1 gp7 family putative phage head morphogenesis protein